MKQRYVLALLMIGILVWSSVSALCADNSVSVTLTALKVSTSAAGKEQLVPAETAKPNEVIEYQATYRNGGKENVRGLKAILPVPPEMAYVPGSARPAQLTASTDGKNFSPPPLTKRVKFADGRVETVEIPADEYRALQWSVGDLRAGQSVTVTARMKIRSDLKGPVAIKPGK